MLKQLGVKVSGYADGLVPLDVDVFPQDNSNTRKEGVSRTYKNFDGYAPIAAYLGMEGWVPLPTTSSGPSARWGCSASAPRSAIRPSAAVSVR